MTATGQRFFARIRSLDIACPKCDSVFSMPRTGHKCWDARLSRFRCRHCGFTASLGIVAYPVATGMASPPSDTIPTVAQSLELRKDAIFLFQERQKTAKGSELRVNKLEGGDPDNG